MAKMVDQGETRTLQILFGSQAVDSTLYLGLYTNSTEPAETANLAALTEVSGYGYSRKTLTRGSWSVSNDLASYARQDFAFTGAAGNVYGYFIATSSDGSGQLLFVEHFSNGPYTIANNGDEIRVTPSVRAA